MSGIKDWLQQKFSGKKNVPDDTTEQSLNNFGIQILSDRKLEERIALLIELETEVAKPIQETDLLEYLAKLKSKTELLNHGIFQIALPYARSGTSPEFARKLRGWTQMYAQALSWILHYEQMVPKAMEDTNEEQRRGNSDSDYGTVEVQIHMMHDNIQKYVWKDAFYFLGDCFMDDDVAPRAAAVIQSMMPMMGGGGGETVTGSGGRTSEDRMRKPEGGPYKSRMKNQVD